MNTRPVPPRTPAESLAPWVWLALGVVVTALAGNRFNVGVLGWVAATPWLVYLRRTDRWRRWGWFFAALQLGTFLSILKIVTEPLPWFFALLFSVPTAFGAFVLYGLFELLRKRIDDRTAVFAFAAIAVVGEWLSYTHSEMGSWGSMAYTQLENLPLLQLASVTGLTGISALLALSGATVALALDSQSPRAWRTPAVVTATLIIAAHAFGALRLGTPIDADHVTVATVTTDIHPTSDGFPVGEEVRVGTDELFERTGEAISRGAELIVWNEGATVVQRDEEPAFVERAVALSVEAGVDLVLAYVVPLDGMQHYENKYLWVTPEGVLEEYFKHQPVPGEGAVRGTDPLIAHDRPWGRAAGAICYDYDFPALGREHAALDSDVVAVPASDWLGIDPYHTQMASVRGIEGGFSVVRSVRWATSGAYDAYGRPRATANWFDGERVMVARVPVGRIDTVYSRTGDALPVAAAVFLGLVLVGSLRRRGDRQ